MGSDVADRRPGATYPVGLLGYSLEKAWFCQFCIGILICINNGACFCFGIFAPYLVVLDGYNGVRLNILSTIGVLLSYFSLPTGFLYDRKGPTATLLAGTVLNATGWAGMYYIFNSANSPSFAVVIFFYGLSQLSASFYETGSVLTNLKSFACYQGRVILIQKTFMGLGSSLVAQLYLAFFETRFTSIDPFFAFLFLYSVVAGVLSVMYLRLPTPATRCVGINIEDDETRDRGGGEPRMFSLPFNVGTGILCLGVTFVLVVTLVENFVNEVDSVARYVIGCGTILLCISFAAMIFVTPSYEVNRRAGSDAASRPASALPPMIPGTPVAASPVVADRAMRGSDAMSHADIFSELPVTDETVSPTLKGSPLCSAPQYGAILGVDGDGASGAAATTLYDLNCLPMHENLRHRELWMVWFVCLGAWGCMTVVSTNSPLIYHAIAGDSFSLTVNTVFVSIYGVASALGRIAVGGLYPYMARRRIPVSAMLPLAPLLNVVGLPLFLIAPAQLLFVPFFVVGLGVGFSWGSTVLIVTALFTTTNCGKHYSFLYTAGMLSPLLFNMALFAPIYDHYKMQQPADDNEYCNGVHCIATALMVCMAVNLLAVPVAYLFYKRTTQRRGLVYKAASLPGTAMAVERA